MQLRWFVRRYTRSTVHSCVTDERTSIKESQWELEERLDRIVSAKESRTASLILERLESAEFVESKQNW